MPVRPEVAEFAGYAPLPSEQDDSPDGDERFQQCERLLKEIAAPVTDEEARLLVAGFGEDNCFGLAWTLLHLVESAPARVVTSEPPADANPWVARLWARQQNAVTDQGEH